jgi:hypothetical protein
VVLVGFICEAGFLQVFFMMMSATAIVVLSVTSASGLLPWLSTREQVTNDPLSH